MLEGNAFSEQARLALPEGNWQLWVTEDGDLRLSDQRAAYGLDEQGTLIEQKASVFTKTQPDATQYRAFAKKIEEKLGPAKDGIYGITFLP